MDDQPPYWEHLDDLLRARGMSRADLAHEARIYANREFGGHEGLGISLNVLHQRLSPKGKQSDHRHPPRYYEALAGALAVDPWGWHEYRLALARQLLDEREVGLKHALENLARFEEALADLGRHPRSP